MSFQDSFKQNFINDNRWKFIVIGLRNTLVITVFALLLGLILGFIIAVVRATYDLTGKNNILNYYKKRRRQLKQLKQKSETASGTTANKPSGSPTFIASFVLILECGWHFLVSSLAKLYTTLIRGTPIVLQLMIIYYIIFSTVNVDKVFAAILAFGINSGAYVSEIFRGGIMSIDTGQMEAGRSLGLNYFQTMWRIVMPQAVKNVLPAIGNEFITLLKETSVAGYIAIQDLTRGADIIRSRTYQPFFPLLGAAAIYLVLVMILQAGVGKLERRLAKSDRR